ncbi:D-3-phosphoglycerate dehydrogenase [Mesonia hippocampi]|uniref:D-3-phosphoglycerate dehydrogenase n=1 Tax=Mesonia hippocampi TaxID=1628250 RepID=A0A840EWE5_9FLAO|nr:2-hydroxyacid dehydrogenase [Mesonia hippocampi]MBB4118394.1 D-3-phosphoglycerate dehydrogenase [Mesonia hippocampi]
MKIIHIDKNHSLLIQQLSTLGFENIENYSSPKEEVLKSIHQYEGIIIRSRFKLDKDFLKAAKKLKFIGRLGAGLENIDTEYAKEQGITLFSAPEGNRNAVGEHALGMLLNLMNKLRIADNEVRNGIWLREENRGYEIEGKTIGIIGYGNMGKAFAKKLRGFDCQVLCYDIKKQVGNQDATQVSLEELQQKADILSLHTPLTPETTNMIDAAFIARFKKPFWFINTARGKSVITSDLVTALHTGKILGAGLDVLEYEKSSFENLFQEDGEMPEAFQYLIKSNKVLLSPHIAGWTIESKEKLAQTIANKIKNWLTENK